MIKYPHRLICTYSNLIYRLPQQEDHCPESEIYHSPLNFLTNAHLSSINTKQSIPFAFSLPHSRTERLVAIHPRDQQASQEPIVLLIVESSSPKRSYIHQ